MGVAQWAERGPANQRVQSDSQSGHMPGLWTRSGGAQEATTR